MLKAKLSVRFYIVSCLLWGVVLFGWYGVFFLNTNEIQLDNAPMDAGTKLLFTVLMSGIVLSWTLSGLAVIRQMFMGCAFYMDENGIHHTATAAVFLAFIFVVPIQQIPYEAIQRVSEENGILTVQIDKSKIQANPILRFFARKEYHFFSGLTKEKTENVKAVMNRFRVGDE